MKLPSSLFVFLLATVTIWADDVADDCINAGSLKHKVEATTSKFWSVTYTATYKIARNLATDTSYLLYNPSCSGLPAGTIVGEFDEVVETPIRGVGVGQTPLISFLDQLDRLDDIRVLLVDPLFIASPCLLDKVEDESLSAELVRVARNAAEQQALLEMLDTTARDELNRTVVFQGPFSEKPLFGQSILVSESFERNNMASLEWIKFISVFFNLEEQANHIYEAAMTRYECISDTAAAVVHDDDETPVVLWAYYSDFCEGWSVGQCPNYYCEYAVGCAVDILDGADATYSIDSPLCGAKFMTIDELVAFGQDADVWIYVSPNWESAYGTFREDLDQMKAVQRQQVYDHQAYGQNAWFEERFAFPFNALQDFCSLVGTTTSPDQRWFRNVFTESISLETTCEEETTAALLYNGTCQDVEITMAPSYFPTNVESAAPNQILSDAPSDVPSDVPSDAPSDIPSNIPSNVPSHFPSSTPSDIPSYHPSNLLSNAPSEGMLNSFAPAFVNGIVTPSSSPVVSPTIASSVSRHHVIIRLLCGSALVSIVVFH